ncbi:hypothetical protein [Microbacterium sp. SORGH_AS_0888]|uniref:hypothetical protein n=1 Tax=Microbacterium sp. SORGH_AS_0888 TaxID=3041791 RepID=UPI0027893DD8|nr:hypothetical protein [Microbacterium sp. SORGH_AS_0888]MDQ1130943.1 hypothetical protein [Microbacterium sp. SORGH_AS_0888]
MSVDVSHVPCILAGEEYPFGRTVTDEERDRSRAVTAAARVAVAAYIDAHPTTAIENTRYLGRYVECYEHEWFGADATTTVDEVVERFLR